MKERSISENEVNLLLLGIVDTITITSKKDEDVMLVMGFVLDKGFVVVFNNETKNLITVRQMRQNEKKLFKET
ncbi:MAG: hypothetical protein KJ995_04360 [Candidatus Omnitrophica bacterium]|nr:hypothetical protein [Candidatus Omnitrophota bacterium]MBU1127934.1 hypothetical protein [Candidatus Omnitrophota bacterium]MBU1851617.1 hypothetical protein [Candidatus Omnitrophota bacterium]